MTPCVVLAALAVAVFLLFCLATRQARRTGIVLLVLLVGDLAGGAALDALLQYAQATLPIWGGKEGDLLVEGSLEDWAGDWGWALMLVAGAWTGALAYLQ